MRKSIYSKQQEVLLRLLTEIRKASGTTQGDLAQLLGFTQSEVSKHERGERSLDFLQVRAWVEALGVPFDLFVTDFEANMSQQVLLTQRPRTRRKAGGG